MVYLEEILEKILKARNADRELFLSATREDLYRPQFSPFRMKDMDLAAARILRDLEHEPILIVGDYDADGVTSTALLYLGLRELGAQNIAYYVPQRSEGYGLSPEIVEKAKNDGVRLIITCDNGIVAFEAIDHARKQGIDVVVTDHHEPQAEIPRALAVVNPKQADCPYETPLSGCGVAWKLLQALYERRHKDIQRAERYLELVAIGTIADVVPLIGENRLIAKFGLEDLSKPQNRGLKALLRLLKLEKQRIEAYHVGFILGPCLNAVGRMATPITAVEMLTNPSFLRSYRQAKVLREMNEERKVQTEYWTQQLIERIGQDSALMRQNVLVVATDDPVPEGIVGLIAGKLKEHFQRPVILLIPEGEGQYKGSGRSTANYNLFQEMSKHVHLFTKFGGHSMACGLTIPKANIPVLAKALNASYSATEYQQTLHIDFDIDPEFVTMALVELLEKLEPYGAGFPRPLFMMRNVRVVQPRAVGQNGKHLLCFLQAGKFSFKAIGFNLYPKYEAMGCPEAVDVAFFPKRNEWNGQVDIQLELRDIRIHES